MITAELEPPITPNRSIVSCATLQFEEDVKRAYLNGDYAEINSDVDQNPGLLLLMASRLLEQAASNGDISYVQSLLASASNIPANICEWALFLAVSHDHAEVASCLIEHGTKISPALGGEASSHGALRILEVLLAHGWDVNGDDCAALSKAKSEPTVKWLLWHGADPNHVYQARNHDGQTALGWAIRTSSLDIITTMLAHGGDITVANAMPNAARRPNLGLDWRGVMDLLLARGADVNALDNSSAESLSPNGTALWYAMESGLHDRVRYLLEHGADEKLRSC